MSTDAKLSFDFTDQLKVLEEELKAGDPHSEEFQNAFDALQDAQETLRQYLEHATNLAPENKKLQTLYRRMTGKNSSVLMDRLKSLGYGLRKEGLGENFDKTGYRLLEMVRAGRRDQVYHGIMRIFMAQEREFPRNLLEPFKPIYSDNLFKVLMYAFLSGVLNQDKQNKKDDSES